MQFAAVTPPIPAIARKRIVNHFLVHHAVSAEDAVPYVPQMPIGRRQFAALRGSGIVREGAGGFWLDLPAYRADAARRRRILVPAVLVCILVAAAIPLFFYRG